MTSLAVNCWWNIKHNNVKKHLAIVVKLTDE